MTRCEHFGACVVAGGRRSWGVSAYLRHVRKCGKRDWPTCGRRGWGVYACDEVSVRCVPVMMRQAGRASHTRHGQRADASEWTCVRKQHRRRQPRGEVCFGVLCALCVSTDSTQCPRGCWLGEGAFERCRFSSRRGLASRSALLCDYTVIHCARKSAGLVVSLDDCFPSRSEAKLNRGRLCSNSIRSIPPPHNRRHQSAGEQDPGLQLPSGIKNPDTREKKGAATFHDG